MVATVDDSWAMWQVPNELRLSVDTFERSGLDQAACGIDDVASGDAGCVGKFRRGARGGAAPARQGARVVARALSAIRGPVPSQ